MSQWVKTKDRLPTKEDATEWGNVVVWRADNSHGGADVVSIDHLTTYAVAYSHWMPLHEPEKDK